MGRKVLKWSLPKTSGMITRIVQNRFDCFIIIEGLTGLGKSTLAIHLARGVSRNFKKMGSKDYKFNWRGTFLYTAKETKQFLHKWRSIGIGDEAINTVHNRDFYSEDSKQIIKMQNMNRDHCNLFIMCVPAFATLDNQIKNLCKIRMTVVRRGLAIIQTPNKTIYLKDRWDTTTNEKIEKKWIEKGVRNPHYSKLTTFRGILKFPALTSRMEEKYQKTKDLKRNLIAKEEMGLKKDEEDDPYKKIINKLKDNQIKNGEILDGMAIVMGLESKKFRSKLRYLLGKEGSNTNLRDYFWQKSKKSMEEIEETKEKDAVVDLLVKKLE